MHGPIRPTDDDSPCHLISGGVWFSHEHDAQRLPVRRTRPRGIALLARDLRLLRPRGPQADGQARRAEQFDADADAIRKSRSDALAAEVNRWLAFLNVAAPNVPKSWDGRPDVHAQIEALGGYAAARDLFKASGRA
jgi:hypothetical protein